MERIIDYKLGLIKRILFGIYYLTLMPYLQRDKYFDILCKDADLMIESIIKNENSK
jgi:hypothetical protein